MNDVLYTKTCPCPCGQGQIVVERTYHETLRAFGSDSEWESNDVRFRCAACEVKWYSMMHLINEAGAEPSEVLLWERSSSKLSDIPAANIVPAETAVRTLEWACARKYIDDSVGKFPLLKTKVKEHEYLISIGFPMHDSIDTYRRHRRFGSLADYVYRHTGHKDDVIKEAVAFCGAQDEYAKAKLLVAEAEENYQKRIDAIVKWRCALSDKQPGPRESIK
jgi:hypothetical protein